MPPLLLILLLMLPSLPSDHYGVSELHYPRKGNWECLRRLMCPHHPTPSASNQNTPLAADPPSNETAVPRSIHHAYPIEAPNPGTKGPNKMKGIQAQRSSQMVYLSPPTPTLPPNVTTNPDSASKVSKLNPTNRSGSSVQNRLTHSMMSHGSSAVKYPPYLGAPALNVGTEGGCSLLRQLCHLAAPTTVSPCCSDHCVTSDSCVTSDNCVTSLICPSHR